ncbi:glutamyl-Q tRNA(Asp) synthetase [Ketogulonicigenium robustum]|uniref:Glutamyl-Q tRNA(Asp) synthetase n=1 Tax=Ketogulonicigenium robustum TaxID=92947 RepID=A0A1W6NZ36_9RHOB|nr:tRNA glutamyl-Q(34) synthetase GluQRS [Ketogulonicigenium robustum]ARO14360.1 glutamyl-Q tRNA(Asp) synthetase [Ketogulonicigenium robustum]
MAGNGLITRFAPSPTGPLHLGHAYAAAVAHKLARDSDGTFLLRIEDIDQSRARPAWEAAIYDDMRWLGLQWDGAVMRQSDRAAAYHAALQTLWDMGLLYPCTCNRRDIEAAASAPQEGAPRLGPDGLVYPGTCRHKPKPAQMPNDIPLRLDVTRAAVQTTFFEQGRPVTTTAQEYIDGIGDIVLARRGMGTSYHLSVVVDDAAQGITLVTRGADLFDATAIHVLLQQVLHLPTPAYFHHRLIRDDNGKRLAKRDDARAVASYRDAGLTAPQVMALLAPIP